MHFLKYMLGKAEVLKTLTITSTSSCLEDEMRLCANLLKFPRHSEIHIVGKYFDFTK